MCTKTGGNFVTVISLDDNELFMTKYPLITDTIIFNVDMKLTTTSAWWWSCSDKKDRNKKNDTEIFTIKIDWKLNN